MSTLEPEAKVENLKKSVESYLALFFNSRGLPVDWEGAETLPGEPPEWVQIRLQPVEHIFHRQVGRDLWGESVYFFISFNFFVRPGPGVNASRTHQLRDMTLEAVSPGGFIVLRDFAAAPPVEIGRIKILSITADRPVPVRAADPRQYNLTVRACFPARWRA